MLNVLDEAQSVVDWANELNLALNRALVDNPGDWTKLVTIRDILAKSVPPACVHCAIERDHFRRSQKRNEKNAIRMKHARMEHTQRRP